MTAFCRVHTALIPVRCFPVLAVCLLFALGHAVPASSAAALADDADGGQIEEAKIPGPTLLIYFENDLFYNEDRYYTNAVQARLISPDLRTLAEYGYLPQGVSNLLGRVPFPGSRDATQYNVSIGFGQHIYTPKNTNVSTLQKKDRPYAGYLYGLLALHAKRENRLDTLELAAGVIGPSSLAEQSQNEVHRIRSIDTAKGWKNQLRDEPALMLTWSRTWRMNAGALPGGWGWDILPRVDVSAGNPYTRAGLGGEARLGWNLPPDYGSSTIRPGSGITRPLEEGVPGAYAHAGSDSFSDNVSLYFFAGADGHAVAWNSFLDGNVWKDSHDVDKFPLSGEINWGVALTIYDFSITYTHVLRAREFHGQDKGQNFGSITVGYSF